jgi:hypothetical protein
MTIVGCPTGSALHNTNDGYLLGYRNGSMYAPMLSRDLRRRPLLVHSLEKLDPSPQLLAVSAQKVGFAEQAEAVPDAREELKGMEIFLCGPSRQQRCLDL